MPQIQGSASRQISIFISKSRRSDGGKLGIEALERQLAEFQLDEFSSLDTSVESIELSAVEVESLSPCAGCTVAEIGSVTEKPKQISVCMDYCA